MDVDLVISPATSSAHECSLQTAIAELLAFSAYFRDGKLIRKDRIQRNGRGQGNSRRRTRTGDKSGLSQRRLGS